MVMSAYAVKSLREMGINIAGLGCVMLDVDPLPTAQMVPQEWAYESTHPDRFWIKGLEAGDHITLLYGLLANANTIRPAIDEVLAGWEPGRVRVESVGSFPSTFDDDPYACVVGHIELTPEILDAHARLSLLPHIDTFWDYKPHLTLGYVHRHHEAEAVDEFSQQVAGRELITRGLNYGRMPK